MTNDDLPAMRAATDLVGAALVEAALLRHQAEEIEANAVVEAERLTGEPIVTTMTDDFGRRVARIRAGDLSVMDATRDQLRDAGRRAAHADAAMKLAFGFTWDPKAYPTLGDFIRALPEDIRNRISEHLVAAGLS